ncbi:hypothetical protein LPJ81_000063 [Coemansia sp. IMI 209127]|nr:hypothetical protein LPJ81_000063 [Coemansia sp. IMI 209127]
MFAALQRSILLLRRCARDLLHANITQLPRRQQKLSRNSFQTYHYSSSASIPKGRRGWTNDEIRKLVEHVRSEYLSRKHKISWKKVGENFGIPTGACYGMYYRSRNIDFTKEYPEAAKNDAKDSKFMVKAVFDGAKKRASSQATWSTDEVARLREARGDRNERCNYGGWTGIAEYVGAGKTVKQCCHKWEKLCHADDLKTLSDNKNNATVANGATNATAKYHARWTPDELLQLKALFDTPSDPMNPRMHIAYALFPQKPRIQVRYTMKQLQTVWSKRRRGTKASEGQPLLRKLVSDSGGAEKADWEAISKEIGVTALQCQRTYHKMTVAKSSSKLWSPDEFDRLLTNLRSQHIHGGAYDWDLAAAAVGTRTSKQCWGRFHYDQKTSRHHLYDFDSSQE